MSEIEKTEFKILESRLTWFKKEMEKLTKRARKLGVEAPTYVEGDFVDETYPAFDEDGRVIPGSVVIRRYHPVTIYGVAPKYAGWTFAATIQTLDGGEVLVRSITDAPVPVRYRENQTAAGCEHCNVKRRRRDTFILVNEAGDFKQVGRQCLKDFLGHASPEDLAHMAEMLLTARDLGEGGFGGVSTRFPMDAFLAYVAVVMNHFGWVSKAKAKEDTSKTATVSEALKQMAPSEWELKALRRGEWERFTPSAEDQERANAAIEWVEAITDEEVEASDYLYNLRTIVRSKSIEPRTAGYAASAIIAHDKAKEKVRERMTRPESQYVGEIGKREVFTLKIERVIELDREWGVTYLHAFTDEKGNELKWFGSSRLGKEGETLVVKATVKNHEEYKGRKQTMVNRCAVYVAPVKKPKKVKAAPTEEVAK